jgi:hypothetical protein
MVVLEVVQQVNHGAPDWHLERPAVRHRVPLAIRQLVDELGGSGSRFGKRHQLCGLRKGGSATADSEDLIRDIDTVLRVLCARPRVCLGPPARLGMTLEAFERRIHLGECRCQIARLAFVETTLVAKLNAHAFQITKSIAHEGRLGAGRLAGRGRDVCRGTPRLAAMCAVMPMSVRSCRQAGSVKLIGLPASLA